MYIILYTLYRILYCLRHHLKFTEQEDPWLCFKYYYNSTISGKKSLWQVLREVNSLCKYWRCFPHSYFALCHWQREYNDMNFLRSFIPQRVYGRFCGNWKVNPSYDILINDKIIFHDLMTYYGVPVPKMVLYYKNHSFFCEGNRLMDNDVELILNRCNTERLFLKLTFSGGAKGVHILEHIDGVWKLDKESVNTHLLRERFKDKDFLIECPITQEAVLSAFNPDTANTIRVLTINKGDGNIQIVSAAVRFGRLGQYVDNMCAGGLAASVDVETGRIGKYAGRLFDPHKYEEHPDSHKKFEGVQIPCWDKTKKLVEYASILLPPYRSVGFDIVTTDNGPLVLEINTGAGMNLAQVGKAWGIAEHFYPKKN